MKRPARLQPRRNQGPALLPVLTVTAAAAVATLAFWNSLHYGLAQDAFTLLARIRGMSPRPEGVWRLIPYDAYFGLMDAWFGLNPIPYRVVGLLLHAANTAMVGALALRLGLGPAAAFVSAMFFAAHNVHFDAVFAVASIGELMAGTFVLLGLLAALPDGERPAGRWRTVAVVLAFAAALLSKETVLLFPVLLWLAGQLRPNAARGAIVPAAIVAVLYLAIFWITDPFGSLRAAPVTNPYQPHWGLGMLDAWATYAAWATRLVGLHQVHLTDRVESHPEGWIMTVIGGVILVGLAARVRRVGKIDAPFLAGALGAALYVCFIAPVLPLVTHAYHYYLYLPVLGLGWVVGAACDAWMRGRARWGAWLLGLVIAVYGVVTVRAMETSPLRQTGLPFMGSVRRAMMASRILESLPAASAPLPRDLAMLGPNALSPALQPDTTQLAMLLFNDVAAALDEGNGIRLEFPDVRTIQFFVDLGPGLAQPDVVVFDYEGKVKRGPTAWLYLRRAQLEWDAGRVPMAAEAMDQAEEMTKRWAAGTQGAWRQQGLAGIRRQALVMLEAEAGQAPRPPDPRAAARVGYRQAVARVEALANR